MNIENKLLRDVMTRGVVTVPLDATVKDVATMLSEQGLSGAAVCSKGEAVGVISDMDILRAMGKKDWESMPVESFMTSFLKTVKPTSTLREAAKMMKDKNIHRLFVFSEPGVGASQRPVGILSASDIIREAAKKFV